MSSARVLTLGFSPCPNDTFVFDALIHRKIAYEGPALEAVMADIETLNLSTSSDGQPLDIVKLSIPAFARALPNYVALRAGAALGFGVGPLVVARPALAQSVGDLPPLQALHGRRVAIPGAMTTAALLYRHFAPPAELVVMRFDEVMPAVQRGEVDAGVVIHEGRFTYAAHGLIALADLGVCWQQSTGLPLGLAVIAARRELSTVEVFAVEDAISRSVAAGWQHPEQAWPFVAAHAQELAPDVCRDHIALYVTKYTQWLGSSGQAAILHMLDLGATHQFWPLDARLRETCFLGS